ncbi:MAG: DUF58 domain-containing protein, partial [bacterium]|nr:DUF58 domain-containing protein [bacterium]
MNKTRYSKYFDPAYLSRIKTFSLQVKEIVEGLLSGRHKSNRFGINVEFKDHREYNPGDELRHVDWRLWAKTDRFYIKRFDEETNLYVNVILDISKSMDFKYSGKWTKLEYAKYIAGSLLYLGLLQNDYVGLNLFSDRIDKAYPPGNRLIRINEILNELEKQAGRAGSEFRKNLIYLSEKIRKRSLVVLISDFLGDLREITDGVQYLKSKKNDIILFAVNDPCEQDFPFKTNTRFIDMENNEELTVNAGSLQEQYKERMKSHYTGLTEFVHKSNIDICFFNRSEER